MKIQGIDAYKSNYVNQPDKTKDIINEVNKNGTQTSLPSKPILKYDINDINNLVSHKERDFFIKLFPESSEQLSRHVLFNRNGQLQQQPISKGLIIDGKA